MRKISDDGQNFGLPVMISGAIRSVVPWSRIFSDREVLLAVNTDVDVPKTAWVTIDNGLHAPGTQLTCLYSTNAAQIGSTVDVERRNGKAVQLTALVRRFRPGDPGLSEASKRFASET